MKIYEKYINEKKIIDKKDKKCEKCKKGRYVETSMYDNIDGTLHCSNCMHQVGRYERK